MSKERVSTKVERCSHPNGEAIAEVMEKMTQMLAVAMGVKPGTMKIAAVLMAQAESEDQMAISSFIHPGITNHPNHNFRNLMLDGMVENLSDTRDHFTPKAKSADVLTPEGFWKMKGGNA
jgi:hypothetical protein